MDLLECYTFKDANDWESNFTRIQPQGNLKLLNNLEILSNLIPQSKP